MFAGGEFCRHALAQGLCTIAGCPFSHDTSSKPTQPPAVEIGPHIMAKQRQACSTKKQHDPTFGQISQYKKTIERPEMGIILVPVASAAETKVNLSQVQPASARLEETDDSTGDSNLSSTAVHSLPRHGFESSAGIGLHPDTYNEIAKWLVESPTELHSWVAAEAEMSQTLPDAFREVWSQYEHREQAFSDIPVPGTLASGAAGPMSDTADAALEVESIQARLRRRMRHSMHVMMQEANPDSYYKDVVHPDSNGI